MERKKQDGLHTGPAASENGQIRAQKIPVGGRREPLLVLLQLPLIILFYSGLQSHPPSPWPQWWLALMLVTVVGGALVLLVRCRRQPAGRGSAGVLIMLTAAGWGLGPGALFFPHLPFAMQALVLLLLVLLSASLLLLPPVSRPVAVIAPMLALLPALGSCLLAPLPGLALAAVPLLAYWAVLTGGLWRKRQEKGDGDERKCRRLQRERHAFEAFMAQAQRIARLASWELDLKTGELNFSPEAYEMCGLPQGERLSKQSLMGVLHWEDRIPYLRGFEQALNEEQGIDRSFRVVRPDGSVHMIRESATLNFDEQLRPQRMFGVMFDVTDRVAAEHKTLSVYKEFNRILDHMQDTYFRTDPSGRITNLSRSVNNLLGYSSTECLGWPFSRLCRVSEDGERFLNDLHATVGQLYNYELQMTHKQQRPVWVSVNGQFVRDGGGKTIGIEGTIRDISELKQARKALYQEKELALVTLGSIGDGVITTDRRGRINYLNPTAERLLGVGRTAVKGAQLSEVMRLVDESSGEALGDPVQLCLNGSNLQSRVDEGVLLKEGGERFHLKVTTAPMRDGAREVVGAVLALHDITEVMGMARQLSYQANHDVLTGLFNRSLFEQRLRSATESALRGEESHALLYMDLDQFKVVNDTCGHTAGDELLQQVAALMRDEVRETDVLARLGGDEFGVLLEHCPVEMAEQIARDILERVKAFRFAWEDKAFEIGISIGLVPLDRHSGDITHVLAAADAACYVAKDGGRNRIHVYQPDDDAVMQRHGEMQWVHRLSSAFDSDRFRLYAQPVAHVSGDRVVSHYEILVRMLDEKGKAVPPGAFIPAAERYNLMPMLDRWVVRTTLEMMREAQGDLAFPPVECAINLSGQSLCDDSLLPYVVDLFDETGIPCESISFEVTETAAVANLTRATRFISVLRGMGCSFALDDFGAGLSSFGYLKSLPVDYLKIDGGFVRDMVSDRVDRAMVESINEIGHIMGLKTIGEYAESEQVLQALERAGVDYAQGHAIAPPRLFSDVLEAEARSQRGEVAGGAG